MAIKMNVVGGAVTQGGKLAPYVADKGDPGTPGAPGAASTVPGPEGDDGWSPIFAGEADGTRTLIKVVDWTGGQGTKPATGMYIGTTGYVATKAQAFNFNLAKKFGVFTGISNAQGIATISFGTTFVESATAPTIGHWGIPATAVGGTKTSIVASTLTKTGVQIKAEAPGLLGSVLNLLVGATVFVIATET